MSRDSHTRGFTLFELLVVLGIFVALGGFSLLVSMETYRGSDFRADRDLLIALLQHARAQAMHNVCLGSCTNGKPHGVHIEATKYILFQGDSFNPSDAENAVFPASPQVKRVGCDIIFTQLSGASTATTTTLSDTADRTSDISISVDGQITWTH